MGRPRKKIDVEKLMIWAQTGATNAEIAAKLEISEDTLTRRFADLLKRARLQGNLSLRSKQFQMAMNGNVTMLVWLGKQQLNQKDKVENTNKTDRLDEVLAALRG